MRCRAFGAVIDACRSAALAEDHAIFNGYTNGGISGIGPSSPHEPITITDDYGAYPTQVAKAVDKMFANSSYETSTDTEKAFNKAFAAQLGNIALIVELVVGAAFATILMIVGNSMIMAVRERTREIGVLKTLGFTGARVLRLVLGESVLLALLGGIPGLLVAFIVTWWLRDSLSNFVPGMTLTPGIALAAVALMIGLGIVTGLLPALNAFRLRIAAALGRG